MASESQTSDWRAEGSFVYRLVWDGEASVNQYSILVQRGHQTSELDCVLLAKRIVALLNASEKQDG